MLTKQRVSVKVNPAVGNVLAGVAQPVEQLICNQQVGGSNPSTSSTTSYGGVPERPNGADCKSVVTDFGGSNPPSSTKKTVTPLGVTVFLFTVEVFGVAWQQSGRSKE